MPRLNVRPGKNSRSSSEGNSAFTPEQLPQHKNTQHKGIVPGENAKFFLLVSAKFNYIKCYSI